MDTHFAAYFNPISLETIDRLIVTVCGSFDVGYAFPQSGASQVRFAISEWSTGVLESAVFSEKDNKVIYNNYLLDLRKWAKMNKDFSDKHRERMYLRLL